MAVADSPTWANAATQLGVTPSALSQGLAELERRLGIELFHREGRRRVLSDQSRPVVGYARGVLAQTGDLGRWLEQIVEGKAGTIRVGMIDAAAIGHYSGVLQTFRANHSDIEFRLTVGPSAALLDQLEADQLDVVVVVQPAEHPVGIEFEELLEEPLAVYGPGALTNTSPPSWGPWVAFPATSHTRKLIASALNEAGSSYEVVAESNQPEVLKEMVRLGMGWAVLPVIQAESEPAPLRRARRDPLLNRTLVAARRSGAISNTLVDHLLDALRQI